MWGTLVIKFDKVNKVYPNGLHALKNVSLEINQGEFVAIIGLSLVHLQLMNLH